MEGIIEFRWRRDLASANLASLGPGPGKIEEIIFAFLYSGLIL